MNLGDDYAGDLLEHYSWFSLPRNAMPQIVPPLPPFVMQAHPDWLCDTYLRPYMRIPLQRFVSSKGKSFRRGDTLVQRWRAAGVKNLLLIGTADDPLLETLRYQIEEFSRAVAAARIDLATSLAFSVYHGTEPFEQNCNMSASLQSLVALQMAGVCAIPAVGFTHREDAIKYGAWIAEQNLGAVFFDLQRARNASEIVMNDVLPVFLRAAPSLQTLLINGGSHPARIARLTDLIHSNTTARVYFTSREAYDMATRGAEWYPSGQGNLEQAGSVAPRAMIYQNLVDYYERLCAGGDPNYVLAGRRRSAAA